MRVRAKAVSFRLLAAALAVLLLSGCHFFDSQFALNGRPILANPDYVRTPPPLLLSGYSGEVTTSWSDGISSAEIDLTNLTKGYVTVGCNSPRKAKFQVKYGEQEYNYDVYSNGTYEVFPLGMGNGNYRFTVFLWLENNTYEYFLVSEQWVEIESEFSPFIVPNQNVNYNADSICTALSYEILQNCMTDAECVAEIYYWVERNISYDQPKADNLAALVAYRPDLDEIVRDKKGICYDYAALVAAMLRINGIPCILVKGDVRMPDGRSLYHAWNMIWLENVGWVAVQMPSTPEEWMMIDLTFARAMGSSVQEYLQGNNYTQLSMH